MAFGASQNSNGSSAGGCIIAWPIFASFRKYRDTYGIATQVSRYVSYREGTVSLQP